MSLQFGEYPEPKTADVDTDQQVKNMEIIGKLNKFRKAIKQQNKMLKEMQKELKAQKDYVQKIVKEENLYNHEKESDGTSEKISNEKRQEKSFLRQVGDAFVKALPSIFRTIASVAVTVIFGNNSGWFGKKGKVQRANSRLY